MRIVGLILGLLGAAAAGWLAMIWLRDYSANRELIETVRAAGGTAALAELDRTVTAAYLLIGAAAAGLVGGVLALLGRGKIAAPLMIIAALAPAALAPKSLIMTSVLLLAGILSLFARPKAAPAALKSA